MPSNGFTDAAQEALRTAQEIVQQKGHSQLDVEHILLALLQPRDGLVSRIIEQLGGDPQELARRLDKQLDGSPRLYSSRGGMAQIHISMRAQRAVSAAAEEAARLNDEYIGVEHLFLAIADARGGSAAELLSEMNINPDRVSKVLREVRHNMPLHTPGAAGTAPAEDTTSHRVACVAKLDEMLHEVIGKRATIMVGSPLDLHRSAEVQPDLLLLRRRDDFYKDVLPTPADVLLIIEVADSPIEFERDARLLQYARVGMSAVWIVNLPEELVEVYDEPDGRRYSRMQKAGKGESLPLPGFPAAALSLDELFA